MSDELARVAPVSCRGEHRWSRRRLQECADVAGYGVRVQSVRICLDCEALLRCGDWRRVEAVDLTPLDPVEVAAAAAMSGHHPEGADPNWHLPEDEQRFLREGTEPDPKRLTDG